MMPVPLAGNSCAARGEPGDTLYAVFQSRRTEPTMKKPELKILQIGAGAMGTRRLRDLQQRTDIALALYDQRPDRCAAAQARFGVKTFAALGEGLAWGPEVLIISTPP